MATGEDTTTVELDSGECALVVWEEDGSVQARVVAAADVPTEGSDLPIVPEFALALAKRILKDPDFQDEVLDWYYDHQDKEADEEGDEDEED
ncbi:MAG: hypothetical protein JOY70_04505 [Acidisphaera sp.]|nr:hypothetical protein [Acidisphaera sp.]